MAARKTRPEKCNCPKPVAPRLEPVLAITTESEAKRLWRHVLIGTSTTVALIEQYAAVGMPHIPINIIADLRDRLAQVVIDHNTDA